MQTNIELIHSDEELIEILSEELSDDEESDEEIEFIEKNDGSKEKKDPRKEKDAKESYKPFTKENIEEMLAPWMKKEENPSKDASFEFGSKKKINANASVATKRGRNKKGLHEVSQKNVKRLKEETDVYIKAFSWIGSWFGHALYYILFYILLLSTSGWALILRVVNAILEERASPGGKSLKKRFIATLNALLGHCNHDIDRVLLAKDRQLIGDKRYKEFFKEAGISSPALYVIKQRRKFWNDKCKEKFKLQKLHDGTGFSISLKALMKALATEAKLKEAIPSNGEFIVKVTMDGRKNFKWADVVTAIVPLNLSYLKTQNVKSHYTVCAWKGEEDITHVKKFAHTLKQELQQLSYKGFSANGQNYKFRAIWVSDLKSLWQIMEIPCDEFCPFCNCKRTERHKFGIWEKRDLTTFFGINDVRICILHASQRIVEKLLKLFTFKTAEARAKINEIISEDWKIKGVTLTEEPVDDQNELSFNKISMISGTNAAIITAKGVELVHKMKNWIEDNAKKVHQNRGIFHNLLQKDWNALERIWKCWKKIYDTMHKTSKELKKVNLEQLQQELRDWGELLSKNFNGSEGVSFYVHIVVEHLVSFLEKKDFSLSQLSNQGLENMHQDHKLIKQRATAQGGGIQRTNPIEQIILRQCRLLLIGMNVDAKKNEQNEFSIE